MDDVTLPLFPAEIDLGAGLDKRNGGCLLPIGRVHPGPRRLHRPRPLRPSAAAAIAELRQAMERQHLELMDEVRRLGRDRRDERESLPALLRRMTELERLIRGSDMHIPPRHTRGRPLGRV